MSEENDTFAKELHMRYCKIENCPVMWENIDCKDYWRNEAEQLKAQILDEFLNDLIEGLQADKDGEQAIEDALTYLKAIRKVINK